MLPTESSNRKFCIYKLPGKCSNNCTRSYLWLISIVVLCLIFLLLNYLVDIHRSNNHQEDGNGKRNSTRSLEATRARLAVITSGCICEEFSVLCVNSSNLMDDLHRVTQDDHCSAIEVLHIERQTFPDKTLKKDWIQNHTEISKLILANSDLSQIESEAFNNEAFTSTFSLNLLGLSVTKLSAGTLLGLSKLERLTIACELEEIDRGFFQPVSATLRFLKLNYMKESVKFEKIFGISKMINLVHLDLSANKFPLITNQGLHHLSKLEYLNLSNSSITIIGKDAFQPTINTLKYLDLSYNQIKRIGVHEFGNILPNGKAYIYLGGNPWVCDCELRPLVDCLEKYPGRFLDRSYCRYPRKLYGTRIGEKLSCQEDTTVVVGSSKPNTAVSKDLVEKTSPVTQGAPTTDTSVVGIETTRPREATDMTSTTSTNKKSMVKLTCLEYIEAKPTLYNTGYNLNLLPPLYNFDIILLNSTTLEVVIHELQHEINLLWLADEDHVSTLRLDMPEYGCQIPHNRSIIVNNLKNNVSYIFCLIPNGEVSITPFNCQPFHVPVPKIPEHKGWISYDKKQTILAIVITVLLISTCSGGTISYFILKNHPDLLKGSKHVLIVKKSASTKISTISGRDKTTSDSSSIKRKKKTTPPPPYQSLASDSECTYECPEDIKDYETPRRHTYSFDKCVFIDISPKSPPPLPKRNSEPTNTVMEHNMVNIQ